MRQLVGQLEPDSRQLACYSRWMELSVVRPMARHEAQLIEVEVATDSIFHDVDALKTSRASGTYA